MPNMNSIISGANKRKLLQNNTQNDKTCSCRENPCPLQGHCNLKNLVYKAELTEGPSGDKFSYLGMTCRKFIERYRVHKKSFTDENAKNNQTTLSKKFWKMKNENKNTEVKFQIAKIARSYTPGDKFCQLCTSEKYMIIKELKLNENNNLNSRDELFTQCRHRSRFKLSKVS